MIEEALDPDLTPRGRGEVLRAAARAPVRWPSGDFRPVSLATLYRWLAAYRRGGLDALCPELRRDRGRRRRRLPADVVPEALRLLEADPHQPLGFLIAVLESQYRAQGREVRIPRSTLQRRLAETKAYERIRRARNRTRRRGRFVAAEPHERWQADAKGPFEVTITSGRRLGAHVLSIIDDATRAVLAARVVESPTTAEAVRVFRQAALRWGLCGAFYADRASIFDALSFRGGLAELGVHRIWTRAGNAPARGKIEAYHRTIESFVQRLKQQSVVDLVHLQQLLDGFLLGYYQQRRHRGIRQTPEEALAGRVSARTVPPTRLVDAFREERRLRAHRVTGEVDLQGATWIVPERLRGQRLVFLLDPPGEVPPVVVDPVTGKHLPLRRAEVRPEDVTPRAEPERWGEGPLQALYDAWTGRGRPQAQPGFGLPELYELLARVAGRHVPASDAEAARIQRVWRTHGPLARRPTEAALRQIGRALGPGRPIKAYLDALVARIRRPS